MLLKKRICKSIALALVGVTVTTPMLKTVSAMENVIIDKEVQSLNELEEIDFNEIRQKFENMSGTARSSIIEINEVNYKAIININTGDIIHTYYNEDGSINETYNVNFYKNLERFEKQIEQIDNNQSRLSGPVIYKNKTSWSPDMLQLQVKKVKKDGKTVHQCDLWNSSNNYKQKFRTKYTSSPSIMEFDKAINDTSNKWNLLASLAGTSAAVALVSFFGPTASVTVKVLKEALKKLGLPGLIVSVDSLVKRWNAYSNAVKDGNNKYNAA